MTVPRDENGGSRGTDGTLGMNRRIKRLLPRRATAQVRQVMRTVVHLRNALPFSYSNHRSSHRKLTFRALGRADIASGPA